MAKSKIKFVLTGSGAVRVNPKRFGVSHLVCIDEEILLFDCGRSTVHGVASRGFPVENINHVFVTHLHFDHICDLPYLVLLSWNIKEIREAGTVIEKKDYTVSALPTKHAQMPNFNYRVDAGGKRIVITSDTNPEPALVEFCRDADLLVSECSGTPEFLAQQEWGGWHMTPQTVGELARDAGVKRVVIKHLVIEDFIKDRPIVDEMAGRIREIFGGEVEAGYDGLEVEL